MDGDVVAGKRQGFWERPVFSGVPLNRGTLFLAFVVLVLVLTRFWDLGNRSFGHDESIHAWEAWKLVTGQGYRHDPVYHGPFGYHLVAFVYFLFGVSDVSARIAPALFSVALVLLVLFLRPWLGRAGSWFAVFLLTISPTLMYRGRYFRHDIWLMVASLIQVICFFYYLRDRRERWLYIIAGALSVGFASKAIAFIYGAIFGSFWVMCLLVEWWRTRKPLKEIATFDIVVLLATLAMPLVSPLVVQRLGWNPLDYGSPALSRTAAVVFVMIGISAAIGIWWKRKAWLVSAAIYYGIFIIFYSSLFTNAQGLATGMVGMLGYWLSQQGVRRGGQPWYYFFFLLAIYEFLPWLLSGLGTVYYLLIGRKAQDNAPDKADRQPSPDTGTKAFVPLLIYWIVMQFVIYSWSGEKMPWQNMHLVLPLGLLGGWFLGRVWDATDWGKVLKRGLPYAAVLLPVAFFSLVVFMGTTGAHPFAGMALDQLQVTLRWLASLVLLVIAAALMYRFGRGLGWAGWGRVVLAGVVVVLAALTVRAALMVSFINQDYATEFLGYADSTPDTGAVVRELEDISRRLVGDKEVKVAYDDDSSWPMVWYLRDFKNATFFTAGSGLAPDAQVVIIGQDNESKLKSQLAAKYLRRQYRLIWWPNEDVYRNLTPAKLWKDLRDPARLKFWWDIFFYRKHQASTVAWPLVHTFALYVRKDIAAQLWNYGPEVAGKGIELPGDEYEKKRVEASAISAWGAYGSERGQFNYPKGIAIDGQGRVYVTDSQNHRVQVFDANGSYVQGWGSRGNAPGQFQEPWGIAVDKDGNVYVADTWNHRIQKFDSQGRFLKQWGVFGDTAGELRDANLLYGPRGIAIDREGNLLVSDTGNKRVAKFTPEGVVVGQWGGSGSLSGQFREPVGLATDRDGNVYVADTWNQRVQKFDASFTFLSEWPVVGWEGESVVNKPFLAVDGKGGVYATSPEYHRVVKYDGTGKVVAVWGQMGTDMASFNMPTGIALDAEDNVYVVDSANHRVLKFGVVT